MYRYTEVRNYTDVNFYVQSALHTIITAHTLVQQQIATAYRANNKTLNIPKMKTAES